MSTKPNIVYKFIDLIINNKKVYNIVLIIYIQDIFSFIYSVHKKIGVKRDYPGLDYNINNFKTGAKVAIEFQINSQNFKTTKKIDIVKIYLFRFLKVYLVDKPIKKTISIPEKQFKEITSE